MGSTVVFGDVFTNRLLSSGDPPQPVYRVLYGMPDTNRALKQCEAQVGVTLGPGTYWLDWQATGTAPFSGPFTPALAIVGQRGRPTDNGRQFNGSFWQTVRDADLPQDFPFIIRGESLGGGLCPADCSGDGKLDIQDFACFQNAFALGDLAKADCEPDSTLNILDFTCFQNRFALGCP